MRSKMIPTYLTKYCLAHKQHLLDICFVVGLLKIFNGTRDMMSNIIVGGQANINVFILHTIFQFI